MCQVSQIRSRSPIRLRLPDSLRSYGVFDMRGLEYARQVSGARSKQRTQCGQRDPLKEPEDQGEEQAHAHGIDCVEPNDSQSVGDLEYPGKDPRDPEREAARPV